MKSQVLFSGIKPSGSLHIGNYLGAIKQFLKFQENHDAFFCIVDLHAITVPQEPEDLRKKTLEVAKIYLAAGLDPQKSTIFIQSHVPAHAELGWILNTLTPMGELQRMTQYKDAVAKAKPALAGLFNYPTLMAADILLYRTNKVPVGNDQLQHIELARSIAERFNNKYGEVFVIPEPILQKEGSRIMSIAHPDQKMSKSEDDPRGTIGILDSPAEIREKIKSAVTDSAKNFDFDPKGPVPNLINIYAGAADIAASEVEIQFKGKTYAEFKDSLAEVTIKALEPLQDRYRKLDDRDVLKILHNGKEQAPLVANKTLAEVKEKMGFLTP
ncbi:MAG: tryptophan--tRNA ligase [Candidatus Sungbacteria bacterium]|nr:tryptophan--tRNA ligase [Candidatus Sungbacteria bacterium]